MARSHVERPALVVDTASTTSFCPSVAATDPVYRDHDPGALFPRRILAPVDAAHGAHVRDHTQIHAGTAGEAPLLAFKDAGDFAEGAGAVADWRTAVARVGAVREGQGEQEGDAGTAEPDESAAAAVEP